MARRYELNGDDWRRVVPHLPPRTTRRGGRRFRDHREVLDGILWRLHTGAQWREVPERYGPWKTIYNRFCRWRGDGTLDRVLAALQLELDEAGLIDHDLWLIDGSSIRAGRSAAGARAGQGGAAEPGDHALGRSRGGWGTKLHLVVDGRGHPLAVTLTPGQAQESKQLEPLMRQARVGRRNRPARLAGDKGYSFAFVRRLLWARGIRPVIPRKSDQLGKCGRPAKFDRDAYRRRNAVERCVGWLMGPPTKPNVRLASRTSSASDRCERRS